MGQVSFIFSRSILTRSERIALVSSSQIQLDHRLNILSSLPIKLDMPSQDIGHITHKDFSPTPNMEKFLTHLNDAVNSMQTWVAVNSMQTWVIVRSWLRAYSFSYPELG